MKRNPVCRAGRSASALGLAIALAAFYLIAGHSPSALSSDGIAQAKPARTLHAPGLPIKVEGRILPADDISKAPVLEYTLTNLANYTAHGFELGLYLFDSKSSVTAGQVWRLAVDLPANAARSFTTPVKNKSQFDEVVLAVQQVRQGRRAWQVDVIPFLGIARISVTSNAMATARFAAYNDDGFIIECASDFCDKQADKAKSVCGRRGVESFECDQANCTVSWECHS